MLIIYIAVFILGSLWGSFSNVCIYRLPERGNIVSARSKCRNCQKKISWFDNIPFISYIILRGKCRNCGFKISFQYFVVELLVALGFLISFHFFSFQFIPESQTAYKHIKQFTFIKSRHEQLSHYGY